MIEKKLFYQPIRDDLITYDNIRKIATSQRDDYITGCLVDYNCFEKYQRMIAIDLSKQQAFDGNPKTMQQINFTGNLKQQSTIFIIIEEAKETVWDFSQKTIKVL